MSITRHFCGIVGLLFLTASGLSAQNLPGRESIEPIVVTLITDSERVRFTAPISLEWRLQVFNAQGETVFDSGVTHSKALDWMLVDPQGRPIETGLYSYGLTIQSRGSEARIQQGQMQIDRMRSAYQISGLSSDLAKGVILTTTEIGEPPESPSSAATVDSFRRSLGAVSFARPPTSAAAARPFR